MFHPFRHYHLFKIMESFDHKQGALDRFLSSYIKKNRAIGSKDRKEIVNKIYSLVRFWRLFDAIAGITLNWEERLALLEESESIATLQKQLDLNRPERYGIGPFFFQKMTESFDAPTLSEQLQIINEQAPIAIRANLLKISREELLELLPSTLEAQFSKYSPDGIVLARRENLISLPTFQDGLFEIQDEGSQSISEIIQCEPGQRILDYCAGSGGKTLAFAPKMKNKGEILLYDIRPSLLDKSRLRLKRAGIYNVRFLYPFEDSLKKYHNKMDWVVVDVPCSGSGSIRRHPELREHLEKMNLSSYVDKQREIFKDAIQFTKPGGFLVYITCSLFHDENRDQVDFFLKNYPIALVKEPIQIKMTSSGPDGFFAALFRKEEVTCSSSP